MPAIVAEYVDRLCSIEMAPGAGNMPRGTTHRLYEAARAAAGEPLTLNFARGLEASVRRGDSVLILTGAGGPPVLPFGETDGLPGSAYLARAITRLLGGSVSLLTEGRVVQPLSAACEAAGLAVDGSVEGVAVIATDAGTEPSIAQAESVFESHRPRAVIGIEKLAPNSVGVIHGATGINYHDMHTNPLRFFELAAAAGSFTGGIGDGGNEVGFGGIRDAVREIMPAGAVCQCPCGAGSASAVACDSLVAAAISDWGALGVVAILALQHRSLELLPTADEYEHTLRAVVGAGALDGVYGTPTLSDDGVPLAAQRGFVDMLRTAVDVALSPLQSPGH